MVVVNGKINLEPYGEDILMIIINGNVVRKVLSDEAKKYIKLLEIQGFCIISLGRKPEEIELYQELVEIISLVGGSIFCDVNDNSRYCFTL